MTDLNVTNAVAERIGERTHIDADECAYRKNISKRHWIWLVDRGAAPQPIRLGRLVRWSLAELQEWERGGCRPIRSAGKRGV